MAADEDSAIYRDLMRFKPDDLTPNAWAVRAGVSRTVWADMRRHGNPSRRTLEKLLVAASSSLAEFEALRIGPLAAVVGSGDRLGDKKGWEWGHARLPGLPLLATSLAGEWGKPGSGVELTELRPERVVDHLPRPPSLASDSAAYALTIVGDSMWPRFRPGRQIAISPQSPVVVGDDVIVRLHSKSAGQRAFVKELVKRTSSAVELRQFNPALSFTVELSEIDQIHKVAGELI